MRKKTGLIFCFLILGIFLIGIVSALYCCEKTKIIGTGESAIGGAWCQKVEEESECDSSSKITPAYCDATEYCQLGTCIDSQNGRCMPNTAKATCGAKDGTWSEKNRDELPQCQLGCCLIGEQVAFVTQASCSKMEAIYPDVEITYRPEIKDQIQCLANAVSGEKGACVYTEKYVKTCKLLTAKKCQEMKKNNAYSDVEFHIGKLCTAPELETDCIATERTKCEGDDVYFVDSCGNLANVYDSTKLYSSDPAYWTTIQFPSCVDGEGNKNSVSCGDCDYNSGSTCKKKKLGDTVTKGEYLCKSMDCTGYSGQEFDGTTNLPKHGETWCLTDEETTPNNLPGSAYYRAVCYDGEVTFEKCDDFRQKICVESSENGFRIGGCKINSWIDCTTQEKKERCEDTNVRDCIWKAEGYYFNKTTGIQKISDETGQGLCVPKYAPGLLTWDAGGKYGDKVVDAGPICAMATTTCIVKYKKPLIGDPQCIENCECLTASWQDKIDGFCMALGDCGGKLNYIGKEGYPPGDVVKFGEITKTDEK